MAIERTFKIFNLELIAHGPQQRQVVPVAAHIHKYTENFVYTEKLPDTSTPIAYYESSPLDAWRNIQLIDQTYVIPANSGDLYANSLAWTKVASTSFSTAHRRVLITHQYVIDEYGKEKPLFFKHQLPIGTVEANIQLIEGGNKIEVDTGMKLDIVNNAIWTNYQNYYNSDTGSFRLYFISSVDAEGNSIHSLLNPVPAIGLADWTNVNLETGEIEGLSYTFEESSVGYTFYLHGEANKLSLAAQHCEDGFASEHDKNLEGTAGSGVFYVKPMETSVLKCLLPSGKSPKDPWHIKVTNGEFFTMLQGKLRKYFVPEFNMQPFSPAKPYIFSPYRKLLWVNRNNLVATRKYLAIDPNASRNITIFAYDADDQLVSVHTTDKELTNTRYSNTALFYKGDTIRSWDNRNAFINMGEELDSSYTYYASYFYEAKEYEYSSLTLNPLQYKDALVNMWVFYAIPDVHPNDRGIHVLGVDNHGTIVYTSQERGRRYPNHQVTHRNGSYNIDTVIGMKYTSMIDANNFKNQYCVPYINDHCYYILGEILVMDIGDEQDSIIYDARRDGAIIKDKFFEVAIRSNQRILQSNLGYGSEGQVVPKNNVMLVRAPITLLEEYGGIFNSEQAKKLLLTNLPVAATGLVHWDYPVTLLNGYSIEEKKVELDFTWEGPELIYKLYRRRNPVSEWKLVHTVEDPPEGLIKYTDSSELESDIIFYYGIRIVEKDIEMPMSNMLGVMIK